MFYKVAECQNVLPSSRIFYQVKNVRMFYKVAECQNILPSS